MKSKLLISLFFVTSCTFNKGEYKINIKECDVYYTLENKKRFYVAHFNPGKVKKVSLAELKDLGYFSRITLNNTSITTESIKVLSDYKFIHSLYFSNTNIGDESINFILKIKGLQFIYISGCNFTESGIVKLQKALGYKNVLR